MTYEMAWVAATPPRIPDRVREKLERFSRFTDGWAFGQGEAFSRSVLEEAWELLKHGAASSSFSALDAFPGRHGNVVVSFYKSDGSEYDFEISNRGILISSEIDGEDIAEDRIFSLPEALEKLTEIGTGTCRSFDYFSRTTTTTTRSASRVQPSSHLMIHREYRSSIETVGAMYLAASAAMQGSGTPHRFQPVSTGFSVGNLTPTRSDFPENGIWFKPQEDLGIETLAIRKSAA